MLSIDTCSFGETRITSIAGQEGRLSLFVYSTRFIAPFIHLMRKRKWCISGKCGPISWWTHISSEIMARWGSINDTRGNEWAFESEQGNSRSWILIFIHSQTKPSGSPCCWSDCGIRIALLVRIYYLFMNPSFSSDILNQGFSGGQVLAQSDAFDSVCGHPAINYRRSYRIS